MRGRSSPQVPDGRCGRCHVADDGKESVQGVFDGTYGSERLDTPSADRRPLTLAQLKRDAIKAMRSDVGSGPERRVWSLMN